MYTSNLLKGCHLVILLLAALFPFSTATATSTPCALRQTEYGGVCVCNSTYCDYLDDPTPMSSSDFSVVSSSKAGLRFDTLQGTFNLYSKVYIFDYDQRLGTTDAATADMEKAVNFVRLNVNREKQYQKIVGFGGAYTGSVAYVMLRLPQDLQDQVHKSFYSRRGIGFNLMRTPIGGCDFDLRPWAYNEKPENDPKLSNFQQLDPRDGLKVAQIKRMKQVAQVNDLKIMGTAWGPPIWMKTNSDWTGNSSLKREYYQTWADYHLRYLELMDKAGLPLWAITTGNEPLNGVNMADLVKFMSLGWTPLNQAIWVSDNLGPTLSNSKYKDVVIFGSDDQRYTFPQWFFEMQSIRPDSMDYIKGLAVHWYFDTKVDPGLLDQTATAYPDHIIVNSESCFSLTESENGIYTPALGSWERGEQYVRGFLQDLKHSVSGWIDWNLILDEQGGPNYVNNFVDSPVVANTTSFFEIYKQPIFYAIGHFSKFIPEGSVRVDIEQSSEDIDSIAFKRPDGSICVIIYNGTSNAEIGLVDSVRGSFVVNIPPRSLHSVIYR